MARNPVYYQGADTSAGPCPSIWGDCPWLEMIADPRQGYLLWDDFTQFTDDTGNGWIISGTNDTHVLDADQVGGVLNLGVAGADNDDAYMSSGNNEQGIGKIYSTTPRDLWFEARVQMSSVTDMAHFIGMAEEGLAAADTLANDTGALASKDFVGFHADTAAPTALDAVWRKATKTAQVHKAGAKTIAISTWYKLGFRYHAATDTLRYYVDGTQVGTDLDVSGATDFPDGEELCILIGIHDGAGAASNIKIDWVRFAQRR